MTKIVGMTLLLIGVAGFATAAVGTVGAPEIDPTSAVGALTLLSGAVLVMRGRKK